MALCSMKVNDLNFADIKEGDEFSFVREITREDGIRFAVLTGDINPLHIDPVFGYESQFGENIVHGMLLTGFFSTLVGVYCPGKNALYLSQTLRFKRPVLYGDRVTARAQVVAKNASMRMLTLKTEILKDGVIAVSGEAKVVVL